MVTKARASAPPAAPEAPKLPREPLFDKRSDRVERAERLDRVESPFDKRMEPPLERRLDRDERRAGAAGPGRNTLDELRQATSGAGGRSLTDRSTADDPFGTSMRKMQSSS